MRGFTVALLIAGGAPAWAEPVLPRLPPRLEVTPEAARVAEEAYGRAVRKHASRDLKGAIAEAEVAWRTVPNASTALIRATLLSEAGEHAEAFAAYLQAADLDPTDDERALIQAGLAKEGPLCVIPRGWARVRPPKPAGATVVVDGVEVTPPRTVGLQSGERTVRATAPDHEPLELTIQVTAGQEQLVELVLTEKQPEPPPVVVVEPPVVEPPPIVIVEPPPPPGPPILPWTLVGVGGALAVTGGVLVGLSGGPADDAATLANPTAGMSSSEREAAYEAAKSDAQAFQTTGYVLLGAGVAAAAAGAVLFVLDGEDEPTTTVAPSPGGLVVEGRF